jgi:hypothetical protein
MLKNWLMWLILVVVLATGILLARNGSQLYIYESGFSGSYTYNLMLNSGLSMMLGGAGFGILIGAVVGLLAGKRVITSNKKHGAEVLFGDWGVAFCILGGLILIVTGIMLGGTWSPRLVNGMQATGFALNMHFLGIVTLLFGSFFTITRMVVSSDFSLLASFKDPLTMGKGKYLPSHGWALWSLIFGFATLVIKGSFLLAVQLFSWPESVSIIVAAVHDILALIALMLGLVALGFLVFEHLPAGVKLVAKPSKATV